MKSAEFCVFGGYAGYKFEHVHSSTSDGNEGYPKGKPLWLWVSNRGEQHPCWHTTFLGKSSVLYLCGADGSRNCSTPRKVWLQLRRSGGKGCPLRGSISDRKRLAGGAASTVCQPCHLRNKGISKPPSAAASHRIRTTTAAFRAGCPSPRPPPSLSSSR